MNPKNGFSLIELLVVLFIIGILFTLATLNVGDFGRRYFYRFQVEELTQKIRLLRNQAVLTNGIFRVKLNHNTFSFYQYRDNQWQEIVGNKAFKSLSFSVDVTLKLTPNSRDSSIIIYPDGQLTPFDLALYQKNKETFTSKVVFNQNGTYFIYPDEEKLNKNKL